MSFIASCFWCAVNFGGRLIWTPRARFSLVMTLHHVKILFDQTHDNQIGQTLR
jgi:hypothetical protein